MSIKPDAIWAASPSTTRGQPTQLSADPKGERIAYASNKSIFLRSIDHPEISTQYTQHTALTTVARFSPSGFYVASGDTSGSVRIWDCVGEGATKGEYHIIAGRINDIAWDGDSQRIVAVGDGKERFGSFITADSGNSIGEVSGQSQQVNCASIRHQRPFRAALGSDDTTLAFYHGAPFKFNTSIRGQHNKFVYGTAFSPDGNSLVSVGSDRKIWLFDGKTGEVKQQVGEGEHTGSIFSVCWAKDSKSFATASADQTVKIWDAEAAKSTQSWRMGEEGTVHIPFQQVGVVWPHNRSDGTIISVDLEGNLNYLSHGTPQPSRVVKGHQGNITAGALSTSRPATLWTGSYEGRVRAWDVKSGTCNAIDGDSPSNYVSGFASSPNNASHPRMYSASWDDSVRTIDAGAKTFTGSPSQLSAQPKGAAVIADGSILAATSNTIEVFKPDGARSTAIALGIGTTATCIAASSSPAPSTTESLVAVGTEDKSVKLYIFPDGTLKSELKDASLTATPSSLAFSPTGEHLAVGTSSGRICVFKLSDNSLATSRWGAHTSRVTGIAWSPDGKFAASASLDTNVFVWSLDAPAKRIKAGNAHKDGVNGVVWVAGGHTHKVLSFGADAAVKSWVVDGLDVAPVQGDDEQLRKMSSSACYASAEWLS